MLMFKEDTWIEVRDQKGDVVVSKLFYPGETYEVKSPEDLLLKTGNIGGMEIRSGDKTFHFKGDKTLVQSNIPLDPQKWRRLSWNSKMFLSVHLAMSRIS